MPETEGLKGERGNSGGYYFAQAREEKFHKERKRDDGNTFHPKLRRHHRILTDGAEGIAAITREEV